MIINQNKGEFLETVINSMYLKHFNSDGIEHQGRPL